VLVQPRRLTYLRLIALVLLVVAIASYGLSLSSSGLFRPSASQTQPEEVGLKGIPLLFEPNSGQTNDAVRFTAHVPGSTLFFTPSEVVMTLNEGVVGDTAPASAEEAGKVTALRMRFVGANPEALVNAGEASPARVSYFMGNDSTQWRTDLPTYTGITYSNLYPGIDLQYVGNSSQLKGTYIVAPGADPGRISWTYNGASSVTLDPKGNLRIAIGSGASSVEMTEDAPVAWQDINGQRIPVDSRYVLAADKSISFALGSYDPSQPLTIDPALTYSTYLGGNWADYAEGITVDDQGNFYVTGFTNSTNFPLVNPYQPNPAGYYCIFVTKFNPAGQPVYSTYLGGNAFSSAFDIAVDSDYNMYITGFTHSTNFPVANAFQPTHQGGYDAFVTKFNSTGSALVFSTYLGGSDYENSRGSGVQVGSIAVDAQRHVYVVGYTDSDNFPVRNALQPNRTQLSSAFATKFTPDGSDLVWSTYLGGSGYDQANGVAVNSAGTAFITGHTDSQDFPVANAFQPTLRGATDAFLTAINAQGNAYVLSTYLGGENHDDGADVALDPAGNAYVTCVTYSIAFPTTPGAFQEYNRSPGSFDPEASITKIRPNGTVQYSTYLGGSGTDHVRGIAVNAAGEAYVMGMTTSSDFPLRNPLYGTRRGDDAFITHMNAAGSDLVFSTFLGGSDGREMEGGGGIAVDTDNNIYAVGTTYTSDFPTVNAFQPFRASAFDSWVSRISQFTPTATPTAAGSATPTACPLSDYAVTSLTNVPFVAGTNYVPNSTCYNCTTPIQLPFPVRFYNQTFTQARLSSSGNLQFTSSVALPYNYCLPHPDYSNAIFGFWDDIHTNVGGIYTSITGIAPNRVFNIEWRALLTAGTIGDDINFTIRLFEDMSGRVEIIYGDVASDGSGATVGVQYGTGARRTEYSCNQPGIAPGLAVHFQLPPCAGGTVTPTTPTPFPTLIPTATPCGSNHISGSITLDDPIRNGTIDLNGVASTCAAPKTCPDEYPGEYNYDAYTYTNTSGAARCVTVRLDGTECGVGRTVFSSAYLGSFDPNNVCANYLADSGDVTGPLYDPVTYSFTVPNGATFVVLVEESNEAFGCVTYQLSVSGMGGCPTPGTGTPTVPATTPTSIIPTQTSTSVVPSPTGTSIIATATHTGVPNTATRTQTGVPSTATSTRTPGGATATSVPPTACALSFSDVPQDHTFYVNVRCLACKGIISGYADGTFRPDNLVTRGQLAKIVSNAAGFTEAPGAQIFQDVAPDHTFYEWINRLTNRGYMSGYTCGSPGEPCVNNRPYFRPFANATRAQTSKIVSNAATYNDTPTEQSFEDVPPTHPFYVEIQRLASRNIMGGYNCGGAGEPCGPGNRPYFRPYNNVTRGQSAKIVANTFFPNCQPALR